VKSVRIGAATGFYGDMIEPAVKSLESGELDYLCFDALAELTMAILQKDRQRNPDLGYARDISTMMRQVLPLCAEKGVKVMTNAGGVNPHGAKRAVEQVIAELGLALRVAVVTGDDLMSRLEDLEQRDLLVNMQTGRRFRLSDHPITFANAYLGAAPLTEALRLGADVVISGRTTDAAQFAAPLIHEFGWSWDDWDHLAKAMALGHLMECSGQAVGGNFSGDWQSLDLIDIGFPIAEVSANGEAIMTKAPGTGGKVSRDTVKEQLLYEVHDPFHYVLPDVVVRLGDMRLDDVGEDRVHISGVTGEPAPTSYKALVGYPDGYLAEAIVGYSWPDALEKARRAAEILTAHLKRAGIGFEDLHVSYLGYDSMHGPLAHPDPDLNEVYLRLAVRTSSREDAERVGRLVPPLGLSGPPFSVGSGMRRPRGLLGMHPILVPKDLVDEHVVVEVS
jgi:hypothetical protein